MSKEEILEAIRHSANAMKRKKEIRKKTQLEESIFDLLIDKKFRKRTAMYIGEKKISTLRGFMDGYFWALDSKEIHLKESDPKFEGFND